MVSVYKNGSKVNAAIQLKEHYHEDIWSAMSARVLPCALFPITRRFR